MTANYIEYNGDLEMPPPFAFNGLGIRSFPLRADGQKLQAICDKFLNIASSDELGFWFRPLAPLVFMQVSTYPFMASLAPAFRDMGYFAENELSINLLVVKWTKELGIEVPTELAYFLPYCFVDSSWAMATGREVLGFPKAYSWLQIPPNIGAPYPTTVETMVFTEYSPQTKLSREPLIRIDGQPEQIDATPMSWPLGAIADQFGHGGHHPLEEALMKLVNDLVAGDEIGIVQLKQFRDAANPVNACYQAVVRSQMKLVDLKGIGQLPETQVTLNPYASLPIADVLGIEMSSSNQTRPPVVPFWMEFDCTVQDVENLYECA